MFILILIELYLFLAEAISTNTFIIVKAANLTVLPVGSYWGATSTKSAPTIFNILHLHAKHPHPTASYFKGRS